MLTRGEHVLYIGEQKLSTTEELVFEILFSILFHVDPHYKVKINYKKGEEIVAHVTPSDQKLKDIIVQDLMHLHRKMGLKVVYSSSLNMSKIISFRIPCTEKDLERAEKVVALTLK